jgi:hypothetical protein
LEIISYRITAYLFYSLEWGFIREGSVQGAGKTRSVKTLDCRLRNRGFGVRFFTDAGHISIIHCFPEDISREVTRGGCKANPSPMSSGRARMMGMYLICLQEAVPNLICKGQQESKAIPVTGL